MDKSHNLWENFFQKIISKYFGRGLAEIFYFELHSSLLHSQYNSLK